MGQENSTGKRGKEAEFYGQVFVQLEQDSLAPGDTVKGVVYANIKQPYPGDKICLKVKGKEFTKWIDREARHRQKPDGTQETYYVDVPREAEIVNIKTVVDIYDWQRNAVLPPGQFSFPIQFVIPKGIPSSFFLHAGTTVAEIRYQVEAFLVPENPKFPKIKHKRDLIIKQEQTIAGQTREVSLNKEVTTCCCFGQGKVSMKTYFEKDAYVPGETARVVSEIDNSQCKLKITNINFALNQHITLRAGNHAKSFSYNLRNMSLGNVEPGQAFVGADRKEASLQLPPSIEGSARSFKGENTVTNYVVDPTNGISPSTKGNLVQSNFNLIVSCGMDGCICDAMPATSIPITIFAIIQRPVPQPIAPAGWNPTQMPAANLSITLNVGGQTIQINTGQPAPNQGGMANNQMPPQQNFGQPTPNPNMNQPMNPQPNFQQQQQQPNYGQPQTNQPQMNQSQGYPQQQQQQQYGQPQMQQQQYGQPQMQQQQYGQPQMQQQQYGQPQQQYIQPQQVNIGR